VPYAALVLEGVAEVLEDERSDVHDVVVGVIERLRDPLRDLMLRRLKIGDGS
jgi:hypothetical protein